MGRAGRGRSEAAIRQSGVKLSHYGGSIETGTSVPPEPPDLERRPRRTPLLVLLGVVVLAVVGVFAYSTFARSVVYYRTPTEVLAAPGEQVRLAGTVVPGSIRSSAAEGTVSFRATDGASTLQVVFEGAVPDTLKDEAEAVAEGSLGPDGVFRADKLFAKCPSKFESETPGA